VVRRSLLTPWFALVFASALAAELSSSLLVHFPGFLLDLGADELGVGLVVGVAGVASILVRPWLGRIMDRHSRRLLIRLGTLAVAVATLMYAWSGQLGSMVIGARLLQGLGQAMAYTAFWTYIADRFPAQQRTYGMALFGISGLLPMGVAPALGDYILRTSLGYRGLFLVATGFSLTAFALALTLERSGVTTGATTTGFRAVLSSRDLRPVWMATAALSLGFTTAFVFIKTYVTTTGLGSVGPYFTSWAAAAIVWRLAFGWVPDRVGPKRMVLPGLSVYAAGLAGVGLIGGVPGLVVGGLLAGVGHGISYPVILTLATIRSGEGDRGTATATFTALFDLVLFAAAPLLGAVIGWLGYRAMFGLVALTLVAGAVIASRPLNRLSYDPKGPVYDPAGS
jgi:MFS family permease